MTRRKQTWTSMFFAVVFAALFLYPHVAQAQLATGESLPAAEQALPLAGGGSAAFGSLTGSAGTVVIFWSNQCPWVDSYRGRITGAASEFAGEGITFILVNSNDATAFPQESREVSRARAAALGSDLTYVMDPGSRVARAFGAVRTPHVFVFDDGNALVYQGTIDDSPGDPSSVERTYLRDVLSALVHGRAAPLASTEAFGCTIKLQ